MDGSWFRRSFFRDTETTKNPGLSDQRVQDDEDILGVTEQLINYVKSFTLETFKNFPAAGKILLIFRENFESHFRIVIVPVLLLSQGYFKLT